MGSIGPAKLPEPPEMRRHPGSSRKDTPVVQGYRPAVKDTRRAKFALSPVRTITPASIYSVGPLLSYSGANVLAVGCGSGAWRLSRGLSAGTLMDWRMLRSRAFWFSLLMTDVCQARRCACLADAASGTACLASPEALIAVR